MSPFDSFDIFRLDAAMLLASGGSPEGRLEKLRRACPDLPAEDSGAGRSISAYSAFLVSEAFGKEVPEELKTLLCSLSGGEVFEETEAFSRADISYVHCGSMWKELFRKGDPALCTACAEMICLISCGYAAVYGADVRAFTDRLDRFYSDFYTRLEDSLSRNFDDYDFIAMDLGLCAWNALDEDMKESYRRAGSGEGYIQTDIVKRYLRARVREFDVVLKSLPGELSKGQDTRDRLLTVLVYDSLRTARCTEEEKADRFVKLGRLCGIEHIRDEKIWYEIRDNRSTFAAESFLLIHDIFREDGFWTDVMEYDMKNGMESSHFRDLMLSVKGILSACEAFTLTAEESLPAGFSADEYMKKLSDRLIQRLSGGKEEA